jgi:hypothetical protein
VGNSQSLNPEGQVRKKERAKKGQVSVRTGTGSKDATVRKSGLKEDQVRHG